MFAVPQIIQLDSGLKIACDEYGDPEGKPVFFFHGWPASRKQGAGFGPEAQKRGLRIISPDRPGIGLSAEQPGRTLRDWPPVVAELARKLGLDKFRVLAVSGGGPYAMATAWALPEQVEAAAVVSGAPPLAGNVSSGELHYIYDWLLALKRRFPDIVHRLFNAARPLVKLRPPHWLVERYLRAGSKADGEALASEEVYAGSFECYQEAWRGSGAAVAVDGEIYSDPWGFAPEEIRVPMTIWHGTHDRSFNWRMVQRFAATIPHSELRIIEEEGHYSLPIRHAGAILDALKEAPAS